MSTSENFRGVDRARSDIVARPWSRQRRGSVLVIVMVTLMFTVLALTAFIDKASTDLIVDTRDATYRRMRQEAYSALEVTLAVLESFRSVDGALRSPSEGWGDPLTFASWTPTEGRTVEVAFEDESAKIPLPRVDSPTLVNLFENMGVIQNDAEKLSDALLNWMKQDYVGGSSFTPDYDSSVLPYQPPARSLRSFTELGAIDVARDVFFDTDGRPNELYHRFTDSVSLFNYARPNLNSAKPDVLVAIGNFDATQQQQLSDYLGGAGNYLSQGAAYFRNVRQSAPILGTANTSGFDVQIRALRIRITVHEGRNIYQLNTVVAPAGGAQTVRSSATNTAGQTSASAATTSTTNSNTTNAATTTNSATGTSSTGTNSTAAENIKKLNYPFTVLEIRENDEPVPTAAPAPDSV